MKLYHGTSDKVGIKCLTEGLLPRSQTGASNWKHSVESNEDMIYLTSAYAPYFGFLTVDDYNKDKFSIIEVETDLLEEHLFFPDEDFIEQASRINPEKLGIKGKTMNQRTKWIRNNIEQFQSNWMLSLNKLGTCCYQSVIPTTAITKVVIVSPKDCKSMCIEALQPTITISNFMVASDFYKTLTKWFMGEEVTFDEWTKNQISRGLELTILDKERLQEYITKRTAQLKNQIGIIRLK
jgi:hypothetical protein